MKWWLLINIVGLFFNFSIWAKGEKCIQCHQTESNFYIHPAYGRGECEVCHLKVKGTSTQKVSEIDSQKVKWILHKKIARGEVYFPLPKKLSSQEFLILEGREPSVKKTLYFEQAQPLKITTVAGATRLKVHPCEKVKGIFTSIKLCVEAEVPLEVEVVCQKGPSVASEFWATFHELWIEGLRPGRYACQIVGRNLKGEEVAQIQIQLDTQTEIESLPIKRASLVEAEIISIEDQYFLLVKAEGRVSFRLGYLPLSGRARTRKEVKDEDHAALRPPLETALYACYLCHTEYLNALTHPVEVRYEKSIGKNVKKIPELPLVEGRVTCISCHLPHTSKLPYLLRKKGKDLCLACHLSRYY